MRRGAFKPLEQPAQSFPGRVVDLDLPQNIPADAIGQVALHRQGERRIILPGEPSPSLDIFRQGAQAEIHRVCIRPKETEIRLGPLGVHKLWKVQFVGEGRVWRKPDGSIDLKGIGNMIRVPAPWPTRIGWYLIGAPIFNTRMLWTWLRGRLVTEGAIVTK